MHTASLEGRQGAARRQLQTHGAVLADALAALDDMKLVVRGRDFAVERSELDGASRRAQLEVAAKQVVVDLGCALAGLGAAALDA